MYCNPGDGDKTGENNPTPTEAAPIPLADTAIRKATPSVKPCACWRRRVPQEAEELPSPFLKSYGYGTDNSTQARSTKVMQRYSRIPASASGFLGYYSLSFIDRCDVGERPLNTPLLVQDAFSVRRGRGRRSSAETSGTFRAASRRRLGA